MESPDRMSLDGHALQSLVEEEEVKGAATTTSLRRLKMSDCAGGGAVV